MQKPQPDPPGRRRHRAARVDPWRRAGSASTACRSRAARAREVMATSCQAQRLELAERYGAVGATRLFVTRGRWAARFTHGEGVDVVVDNVGDCASVLQGLETVALGRALPGVAYLDETFEIPSIPLFKDLAASHRLPCPRQDLIDVCSAWRGPARSRRSSAHPMRSTRSGKAAARLEIGRPRGAHLAYARLTSGSWDHQPQIMSEWRRPRWLLSGNSHSPDPLRHGGPFSRAKREGIYVYRLYPLSGGLAFVRKTHRHHQPVLPGIRSDAEISLRCQSREDF